VPDTDSIELLIEALGDPDLKKREASARAIFQQGRELARPAVDLWMADAEFKSVLVFRGHGFPVATVGVALQPATFDRLRAANGSPSLADVPPDQDAKEFELHFGTEIQLDILTTREPEGAGAIARFLSKLGEGIQQIELMVHNVDRATEILQARFSQAPIYPATRPGADGTRVNFFLVATPKGRKVLIELVEENPRRS
jgi:hypothetical protein